MAASGLSLWGNKRSEPLMLFICCWSFEGAQIANDNNGNNYESFTVELQADIAHGFSSCDRLLAPVRLPVGCLRNCSKCWHNLDVKFLMADVVS